jgi:L-alanine-DL-glutamate epimerase-like enolase superfamily enzyme
VPDATLDDRETNRVNAGPPSDDVVIQHIEVSAWRVPMIRAWGADVTHHHLILTEVTGSDGLSGHGFTWTPQIGPTAIASMLVDDCVPAVVGGPAEPSAVWDRLWRHLREAGGGGVTTLAMAAIDIALWDRLAKTTAVSLVDLIGRRHRKLAVYGSGVNFHYSLEDLQAQAHRWVDAGFGGVKIKVGRPDLDEDLARVAAVRRIIGPDRTLMVDANQRWTLDQAKAAARALERFEPAWLEEPLVADDLAAHAELRSSTSIPIAIGENLATVHQFDAAAALGACDIVQPNVVRVGGITPFLRIAERATAAGLVVAPHLLADISAQLAMCLDGPTMVEDVEDSSWEALGVLAGPSGVDLGAEVTVETGPGHGLRLEPWRVPGAESIVVKGLEAAGPRP